MTFAFAGFVACFRAVDRFRVAVLLLDFRAGFFFFAMSSPLLGSLLEMFSNPSGMFEEFRRVSCD